MYSNRNLCNIFPNKFITSLFISIALFTSGCGAGGGSTESKTGALTPSSIAITPVTATVAKGQVSHFTATATYTDGSAADITSKVTWVSANTSVATIDSTSGAATGVVMLYPEV